MPDPMTLECFGCDTGPGTVSCTIFALQLNVTGRYTDHGKGMLVSGELTDGGALSVSFDPSIDSTTDLTPASDWMDAFASLEMRITGGSSLLQILSPGDFAILNVSASVEATYHCTNDGVDVSTRKVTASLVAPDAEYCYETSGVLRAACSYVAGGGSIILYSSSPFADCNGCTATAREFRPKLTRTTTDVSVDAPNMCVCASGGTPPYTYFVSGILPDGMVFDVLTGCLSGLPTSEVTAPLTITAVDSNIGDRQTATATCMLTGTCGGLAGPGNRLLL